MMRLWTTLGKSVSPACVMAQWQHSLEEEWGLIEPYLRPREESARAYPCLDGKHPWASYDVVRLPSGGLVGICAELEDRIELSREELVVYELDVTRWLDDVASAFDFERTRQEAVMRYPACHRLGNLTPTAGMAFPAYLSLADRRSETGRTICTLVSQTERPFLLMGRGREHLGPEGEALLERGRGLYMALSESLISTQPGHWVATESAWRLLASFSERNLPETVTEEGLAFYPTPPRATWSELRIRFTDGHTISVSIRGVTRLYQYADLGMEDRRSKRPSRQWELLRKFAKGYGILTRNSRRAAGSEQKRRERLSRELKAFFRIEGEPILVNEDFTTAQTLFQLEPDG